MAPGNRGSGGAFEADVGYFQRGKHLFRQQLPIIMERAEPGLDSFPFDVDTGRVDSADRRIRHFGSDAVSGNERYLMSHTVIIKVRAVWSRIGKPNATTWWNISCADGVSGMSECCGRWNRSRAKNSFPTMRGCWRTATIPFRSAVRRRSPSHI